MSHARTERDPLPPDGTITALAALFAALGDATRLRLVALLAEPGAEYSVQALADALGMSHSAVSHQLRLLRELRLVRARRDGRHRLYTLDDDHVARLFHEGMDHVLHG